MFAYALFLCGLVSVSGHVLRNPELYRLDIVHYNDFHDRFEETSVNDVICHTNDSRCLGGFARLYYEIHELLREKPDALVLNAGDTFQGTYWYTLFKWNVTQKFINLIPNDVHALGNHEFDDGLKGLIPYIKALKAPVVAANLESTRKSGLNGLYKPHVVIEKNGRKIGIIGLITEDTGQLSNAIGVRFLKSIPVVKQEAQLLTDQGVDIIVVLSHCGLDVDLKMAKEVGENIDLIVGGHTHSLLWNGESPTNETISGPYPMIVESEGKPGHKVLVVTASSFSKYLGNITAYFDRQGDLQSFDGEPVFLNRSIPEDPEIKGLLDDYKEELHKIVDEVIGFTDEELEVVSCGGKECALGDLIADAYLNQTKEVFSSELPFVSFMVRNMIRGPIPKGDITRGAVINAIPFTNKVVTFTLKGKYLIQALGKSVTNPWVKKPYLGPFTAHVSGIKVKTNTTAEEVMSIEVKNGDKYEHFDPEQDFQIVTLDFIAKSGFFNMIKENKGDVTFIGKDSDLIEQYIRKVSPITPSLDGRMELVS